MRLISILAISLCLLRFALGEAEALLEILGRLWQQWPGAKIVVRGDSDFFREGLMRLCEAWPGVDYVFGLAKNERLEALIAGASAPAKAAYERSGGASRVFADFEYRTRRSWGRSRRVVTKAEHLAKGANPRFVVTSLAYTMLEVLRREGLAGTELEHAQCGTIRLRLLKVGARVKVTVRRVWVSLPSACPYQAIFARAFEAFGPLSSRVMRSALAGAGGG